jgi:hypothetical protein
MNYEFKKLSEVESLNEVPENATVLAEVDGSIKRIPSSGLGGSIKTAIIKQVDFDDAVAYSNSADSGNPTSAASTDQEFSCINMTFEEAYETILAGEPLDVILMIVDYLPHIFHCYVIFGGVQATGSPCIGIGDNNFGIQLIWTADGIGPMGGNEE